MSKTLRNKFGKRIRELRKQKDWSQEELADKVGLHRTYIGTIERGEQNVSIDNIEKLAKTLGISLERLFKDL
jgi:transcriptional regulator with XRE-family HTH domain